MELKKEVSVVNSKIITEKILSNRMRLLKYSMYNHANFQMGIKVLQNIIVF